MANKTSAASQGTSDQIVPQGKGCSREARPTTGAQPNQPGYNPNTPFQPRDLMKPRSRPKAPAGDSTAQASEEPQQATEGPPSIAIGRAM
eukprot:9494007-Karenia_brevis.AAC.1